jgi:hypothetical protein
LDTCWSSFTVSAQAEVDKEAALRCYRSQTAVANRFLTSFIRRAELFGALPPESLSPGTRDRTQWRTAIADTTRDTLIRGLEGSGDITGVEAGLSGGRLHVRVTTRRPLSPRLTYAIRLHPLGQGAQRAEPLTVPFRRLRSQEPLAKGEASGQDLEISIPLIALGDPTAVMVGADTCLGRVPIDRAGWRLLRLPQTRIAAAPRRANR